MIVYDYIVALLFAFGKIQGPRTIIAMTAIMAFFMPFIVFPLFFNILHWLNINYYINGFWMPIIGGVVIYFSYDIFLKINFNRIDRIELIRTKIPGSLSLVFLISTWICIVLFFVYNLKNIIGLPQ